MAGAVKLRNVRTPRALGCYVTLAKPRAMEAGKDPEYSIALLFPKASSDMADVRAAINEAAISKWGPAALKRLGVNLRTPLRDGDSKMSDAGAVDPVYKGHWFVNAKSKTRVPIVDHTLAPVDPSEVYSGCYFQAQLRFFPYDKSQNKGVGCGLQNIMLVGRGKRIDGRQSAEEAFKDFTPDVLEGEDAVDDLIG